MNRVKNFAVDKFPSFRAKFATPEARKFLRVEGTKYFIDILNLPKRRLIRINRKNAVFTLDMMNFFDYFFDSVEPISIVLRDRQFLLADFSTPRYHEIRGFSDFPILCPTITEPFVTAQQYLDVAQLQSGNVVLDLGAYSGLTAICFAKKVGPTGRVIAVEPDPLNFHAASKNIALNERVNCLNNILLLQRAVSDRVGNLQFSGEGTMGSSELAIVGRGRGDTISVESVSLTDLMQLSNVDRVDFIKMDIEGTEDGLLKSSADFFATFRPRMVIEPHVVQGRFVTDSVIRSLSKLDYRCHTIEQYGVTVPLIVAEPNSA